jgi:DNA (cytosine-5)-methyltransferase 1
MNITLGTDCTGIDSVYFALKNVLAASENVAIVYKFASEIDPRLHEYLHHTTRPDIVYDDLTKRDLNKMEAVDLYVAGFPCQTFSAIGNRKGFHDTRGTIIFHIIEYLRRYPPKTFILENVTGLKTHNNGKTLRTILDLLHEALPRFHITTFVISPWDIGFPQSRKRLFIIGSCAEIDVNTTLSSHTKLSSVLMSREDAAKYHATSCRKMSAKYTNQLERVSQDLIPDRVQMVNLGLSSSYTQQVYTDCAPCLTRFCYTFYITSQQRFLTAIEALRLQGFEDSSVATYLDLFNPQNKNKALAYLWAANSICIPVLEQILRPLLPVLIRKIKQR